MNRSFLTAWGSVGALQNFQRGSAAIATAALTVGAMLIPSTSLAFAEDTDKPKDVKLTKSGHLPGNESGGPTVGKDVTYKTKSGKTKRHPCAGKKLVYQFHNDYIYGTRDRTISEKGDLAVMAVDGQQVVNQDSLCFRLPVDANQDGEDVTRHKLPLDPDNAETYKFLGNDGDIVWVAPRQPQGWANGQRPTFAGIGAFDPHHEGTPVKTGDFVGDEMHFDIVKYSGPGDMHVFAENIDEVDRLFSVKKGEKNLPSFTYGVNGHGHWNTVFTKPGIYTLTVKGWVENKDGTKEETKPTKIRWLVGTDKQVGLPSGTTTNLNKVKTSPAGDDPDNGADTPSTTSTTKPSESNNPPGGDGPDGENPTSSTTPTSSEGNGDTDEDSGTSAPTCPEGDKLDEETATALANKPQHFIENGHIDMALDEGRNKPFEAKIHVDGSDGKTQKYRSGSFGFVVPDSQKKSLPNGYRTKLGLDQGDIWHLPQAQVANAPWPGFSTTSLKAGWSQNNQGAQVTMEKKSGPGEIISWSDQLSHPQINLSTKEPNKSFHLTENSHVHMNWGFTKPGIYRVVFHMRGKDSKGQEINEPLDVVFLVGNDAFAKAKDLKEKGYPCVKGPAVDGGDGGTTDTDPDGGAGSDGSTDTGAGSGDGTSGDGSGDSTTGDSESDGDQPADASGDEALGDADGSSGESGSGTEEGEDGSRGGLLASTGVASIGVIVTLMAGLFAMLVGAGVMMNRQTQQLVARHKEIMLRNRKGRF